MKIGIDYHGVIDELTAVFQKLAQTHVDAGHEVHIITGFASRELIPELEELGFHQYTHIFSIVDHFESLNMHIEWIDDKPYADKAAWDVAKRNYCEANNIHIMYDDSPTYKDTFDDIDTIYCHVSNPTRTIYSVRDSE